MKNFILGFIVFALSLMLLISVRSCNEHKKASISSQIALQNNARFGGITPLQPVKTIRDTIFKTEIKIYEPVKTDKDIAESGAISPAYIDSISRALNIASNKITSLTKANMNLSAKLKLFSEIDTTTGRLWASYKDKTFDIKYFPDSNEMDITANVGLNFIDHKSRKHFLQKWHHYTVIWSNDDRFTINGFHRIIRDAPKSSRWGVDAFAGPSFSKEGMNMAFGVGIGYRLIEF